MKNLNKNSPSLLQWFSSQEHMGRNTTVVVKSRFHQSTWHYSSQEDFPSSKPIDIIFGCEGHIVSKNAIYLINNILAKEKYALISTLKFSLHQRWNR